MKTVCVIGLGYIGLPTALLLVQRDFKVIGVDVNQKVVGDLKKGKLNIKEPDLERALNIALKSGKFEIQTKASFADIFIIAVPTPFKNNNSKFKEANIDFVLDAAEELSKYYKPKDLVILESTSPVGTTEKIFNFLKEKTKINENDIDISYCPERVIPGNIFFELINNDRIIGSNSDKANRKAKAFYQSFCKGQIHLTSSRNAELVKLTENSYRDVNIAFANELSMICKDLDLDVKEIIQLANCHPRVQILNPGCGVGGHCIAVDPWFIISKFPNITFLLQTARNVNLTKTNWTLNIIKQEIENIKIKIKKDPVVGILGITYKPNTDDLRESPALNICKELISQKYNVIVCDPYVDNLVDMKINSINEIILKSHLLVKLVNHDQFELIDFGGKSLLDFS